MRSGWRRVGVLVVAVVSVAAAPATPAPAQTSSTSAPPPPSGAPGEGFSESETLPELHEHLDEAVAEEAGLVIAYQQATERLVELDRQVVDLTAELEAATDDLAAAEDAYVRAYDRYVAANLRFDQVTAQLLVARDRLRRQAVAAYTGGGSEEDMNLAVLTAHDTAELASGVVYAEAVVEHQHDLVEQVDALREELDRLALAATEARAEAEGHRDEVADRRASLETAREHLVGAREAARQEQARQDDLLRQVRERRAEYEARIEALKAENARIAALIREYQAELERQQAETARQLAEARAAADQLASEQAGQGDDEDGVLLWPLPGATVTSGFGYRIHPIYGTRRLHTGLDMGGAMGAELLAAADGVVALAGVNGGYGNCVVVYHGDGMSTLYGHQSRIGVEVGDVVRTGDVIGYVGSTGVSTGPHLHFEVRINGEPVNPMPFL